MANKSHIFLIWTHFISRRKGVFPPWTCQRNYWIQWSPFGYLGQLLHVVEVLCVIHGSLLFLIHHFSHLWLEWDQTIWLQSHMRYISLHMYKTLGDFLWIRTSKAGQSNPLFHTFTDLVNRAETAGGHWLDGV